MPRVCIACAFPASNTTLSHTHNTLQHGTCRPAQHARTHKHARTTRTHNTHATPPNPAHRTRAYPLFVFTRRTHTAEQKNVSREHAVLNWDEERSKWTLKVLGKNGLEVDGVYMEKDKRGGRGPRDEGDDRRRGFQIVQPRAVARWYIAGGLLLAGRNCGAWSKAPCTRCSGLDSV